MEFLSTARTDSHLDESLRHMVHERDGLLEVEVITKVKVKVGVTLLAIYLAFVIRLR